LDGQATALIEARLREIVGSDAGAYETRPLRGGPAGSGLATELYLLSGASWRVVLKVCAPAPGQDDPAGTRYWRREPLLFGSRLLDDLPGLKAPRCYGVDESADGRLWVWLEHVADEGEAEWTIERWGWAARRFGQFGGAYLTGARELPHEPWLGGGRLRSWLGHHVPMVERIRAAPDDPAVAHWWPRPVVEAVLQLWAERDVFCDALERLPQTFGHGDAIRRNLFVHGGELVAIDWEHAGRHAPGEDVGQALSVAPAFFWIEPAQLPALDEALFDGYLAGLRDAGWLGDEGQVRFAFAAHAALRNGFNAVGSFMPNEEGLERAKQTWGHTFQELAERRAQTRPYLLGLAEEARQLF
jgi:hypothetical protein